MGLTAPSADSARPPGTIPPLTTPTDPVYTTDKSSPEFNSIPRTSPHVVTPRRGADATNALNDDKATVKNLCKPQTPTRHHLVHENQHSDTRIRRVRFQNSTTYTNAIAPPTDKLVAPTTPVCPPTPPVYPPTTPVCPPTAVDYERTEEPPIDPDPFQARMDAMDKTHNAEMAKRKAISNAKRAKREFKLLQLEETHRKQHRREELDIKQLITRIKIQISLQQYLNDPERLLRQHPCNHDTPRMEPPKDEKRDLPKHCLIPSPKQPVPRPEHPSLSNQPPVPRPEHTPVPRPPIPIISPTTLNIRTHAQCFYPKLQRPTCIYRLSQQYLKAYFLISEVFLVWNVDPG